MSRSVSEIEFDGIEDVVNRFVEVWDAGGYEEDATSPVGWETWKWDYQRHLEAEFLANTEVTKLSPSDVPVLLEVLDEQVSIGTTIPAYMLGGGQNGGVAWHEFKEISEADVEATADTLSFFFDPTEDLVERLDRFREFYADVEAGSAPGSLLGLGACLLMFVHPGQYVHYKWTQMRDFFGEFADYKVNQGFDARQYQELNIACQELLERLQGRVDNPSMLHVQTMIWSWDDLLNTGEDPDSSVNVAADTEYYWVNQSNPSERDEEYLRSSDTYFTRDLTKLEPGDVLLHYWDGGVRAHSVVQTEAYEVSGADLEGAENDETYWRVDVDLTYFDTVREIETIAPVLRRDDIRQEKEKYAVNATGVQSWYLCNLTAAGADYLLNTYPDEPEASETGETQYFWVNAEATDWHHEGGEVFYRVTNSDGEPRRNIDAYREARRGDEALVYQVSPVK
ncbi:hypothetical protein [Halovenus carboxidivorans]|uniref:hypothetical protein n=1 Tax=Halovenus carboxidivorans TaxID=2692199 RepID=UPI0019156B24|nr:hypothetical protein [Halovenus carboxidivorans]